MEEILNVSSQANVHCPLCDQSFILDPKASFPYAEEKSGRHLIAVCDSCGIGVMYPPETDEEAKALYQNGGYWDDRPAKTAEFFEIAMAMTQATDYWKFLLKTATIPDEIRVLDIGAGEGCFGLAAGKAINKKLMQYCPVEPDGKMRKRLEGNWEKYGTQIKVQASPNIESVTGKFEVIALSHILEHLKKPRELLENIKRLAAPKCFVFFEIPHNDFRFKNDVTGHLTFWGVEQIRRLFRSTGYELIRVGIFGNPPMFSPASKSNLRIVRYFEGFINKLKPYLPFPVTRFLYQINYGTSYENKNGIWIRGLARLSGEN